MESVRNSGTKLWVSLYFGRDLLLFPVQWGVPRDVLQGVHKCYKPRGFTMGLSVLGEDLPNSELSKRYLLNGAEEMLCKI
jgi:hypothetical protein